MQRLGVKSKVAKSVNTPQSLPATRAKPIESQNKNCTPLAALLDQTSLRCTCNHCKHSMTSSLNREPVNPEKTTTEQLNDVGMLKVSYFDVQDVPQSRGIGLSANPENPTCSPKLNLQVNGSFRPLSFRIYTSNEPS